MVVSFSFNQENPQFSNCTYTLIPPIGNAPDRVLRQDDQPRYEREAPDEVPEPDIEEAEAGCPQQTLESVGELRPKIQVGARIRAKRPQ